VHSHQVVMDVFRWNLYRHAVPTDVICRDIAEVSRFLTAATAHTHNGKPKPVTISQILSSCY
jgi:hypothetical protein